MKQVTKVYTLYSFDELSDKAKETAIEKLYDINVNYDWWNSVYEDAEQIGVKIESFDIDRGSYCKGDFEYSAEYVAQAIVNNHGESCETHKTATKFLHDLENARATINTLFKDEEGEEYANYDELNEREEELREEFKQSLFEDYRIMLQKEYEYLTSEEAIIETIEANEYTFLEDGTMKNF